MTEKTFRQPNNERSIKEFVRQTPLFSERSEHEFRRLYDRCEERLYDKGALIAHARKKREGILLITSGMAEVYAAGFQHEREVLELAGPGEVVGLASLSTMLKKSEEPTNTVEIQALETTLGLFVPYEVLREVWKEQSVQSFFLEKAIFRLQDIYRSFTEQLQQSSWMDNQRQVFQRVQDMMSSPLKTLPRSSTVKEGIDFMVENNLSAVVFLSEASIPKVVSMRGVMNSIAANYPLTISIDSIVHNPSVTVHRLAYYYEALSIFQKHPNLRHVVVVDDHDLPIGMLTLSDVLKQRHRSIQHVMKQLDELSLVTLDEVSYDLKRISNQLVEERESIRLMVSTMTPLYDLAIDRVILLAQELMCTPPPCEFSFYQMGSGGRGEQLMMTDQDHFLVYEVSNEETDRYFEELGAKIVDLLEQIGFARCDGDMMASHSLW